MLTSGNGVFVKKQNRGELWADFQNNYFKENAIDLQVDQTHIIATEHEGRIKDKSNYHATIADKNKHIKQENIALAKDNPDVIVSTLEQRQSVFNERDIKSLILKVTDNREDFDALYSAVMADKRIIPLGYDDSGRMALTTRDTFKRESELIILSEHLSGKSTQCVKSKWVNRIADKFSLSAEQTDAVTFIAKGGDLTCLDGVAGAGKTHAMKAIKAMYDASNTPVTGAAIAGKAAHGLEAETGIASHTIYSIVSNYRKGSHYHRYLPAPGSVLIIDEAGMVGLDDMHVLLAMADERNIKLVPIGDREQLASIARGAPLKAMVERVGCATLSEVRRQKEAGDRKATVLLKQGKVGEAIDHYLSRDQIIFDSGDELQKQMIAQWMATRGKPLEDGHARSVMMLAFRREQVGALNAGARASLKEKGVLSNECEVRVCVDGKEKRQGFAVGEQIVLLKNATIGEHRLKRGQLGVIQSIHDDTITMDLDGKLLSFSLDEYNQFDYGYALTVHKAQGVTVDDTLILAQGYGWDVPLTYVAMSRHRHGMYLFADSDTFSDVHGLKRELSRKGICDNVVDYPLGFAIRRGMDADTQAARASTHSDGGIPNDSWAYLRQVDEANAKAGDMGSGFDTGKDKLFARQRINEQARSIAYLSDLHKEATQQYHGFIEAHGDTWYEDENAKSEFAPIEALFDARNLAAFNLLPTVLAVYGQRNRISDAYSDVPLDAALHDSFKRAFELNRLDVDKLVEWAKAHEGKARVEAFMRESNPYAKGKLAQAIVEMPSARKVVASQHLWAQVNTYYSAHVVRHKTLQLTGFAARLKTVESYLAFNGQAARHWRKSQAEHFGPDAKGDAITAHHVKLSNRYNRQSEVLAHNIMSDKRYLDVLAVKFAHKASYERIVERILARAQRFDKRVVVRTYIDPSSSEMERAKAAYTLNDDYRGYFGVGREEGLVWSGVAKTAQRYEAHQFREGLAPEYQAIFDSLQAYQDQCKEVASLYREAMRIEKALKKTLGMGVRARIPYSHITDELSQAREAMYSAMAHRHKQAYDIAQGSVVGTWVDTDNTLAFDQVHYHLDARKFMAHVVLHEQRLEAKARVEEFAAIYDDSPSNLALGEIAYEMTHNMGKHRYHLKKHEIDTRLIERLSLEYQFAQDNRFTGVDGDIHQVLGQYIIASMQARAAWQDVRLAKRRGEDATPFIAGASRLLDARNRLAFDASALLGAHIDTPAFDAFYYEQPKLAGIDVGKLIKAGQRLFHHQRH